MLKPEDAKARLAEWTLPEGENPLAAAVKKLPEELREIAELIWELKQDENKVHAPYDAERNQRELQEQIKAVIALDKLAERERLRVFAAISPALAPMMEQALQLLKTLPYQQGYSRKAFRAPNHPDGTAQGRLQFLGRLGSLATCYRAEQFTPAWLATWAPYLGQRYQSFENHLGVLLAAVLNQQSPEADEVFEILRQSLSNQHEIGAMGRHVIGAFLLSNRQQGWELIEKTLLAAQRQEGLRQSILEAIDESHPTAFRRMLRLILDEDLIRFSATVRAVDVWFGQLWSAAAASQIKNILKRIVEFLEDSSARDKAIAVKDAEAAFLALWCLATEDAIASIAPARKLLAAKSVELRYVAAKHLANLDLDPAAIAILDALDDADLRVALLAVPPSRYNIGFQPVPGLEKDDRFEKIERLLDRVPTKPQKLAAIVWPWTEAQVKQSDVASWLLRTLGSRPATRLIPHLDKMETRGRQEAVELIAKAKPWDATTRQALLDLAGETAANVRGTALQALRDEKLEPKEIQQLESYLTRKAGDLRRDVLEILLRQPDAAALASGARLLEAKDANQRLAGLELLRLMTDAKRGIEECRQQAAAYASRRPKRNQEEQSHLDEIAKDKTSIVTLDDALGLMNVADRSPVIPPRNLEPTFVTSAAVACLKELDDLIHEHRETTINVENYHGGMTEYLLGDIDWYFPSPQCHKPRAKQVERLPLADIWNQWLQDRGDQTKDADGLELVRALAWLDYCEEAEFSDSWTNWIGKSPARKAVAKTISGGQAPFRLRYERAVKELVQWLLFLHPVDGRGYVLNATETAYALVPAESMDRLKAGQPSPAPSRYSWNSDEEIKDWRDADAFTIWPKMVSELERLTGKKQTIAQRLRYWLLLHWVDQPVPGATRNRPDADLTLEAYQHGAATLADVADHLLGPRGHNGYSGEGFSLLSMLTARSLAKEHQAILDQRPELRDLVDRAKARILDLELNRGDAPTAATIPSYSISALWGAPTLHRILLSLGKAEFKLGRSWSDDGKQDRRQTLTYLAKITYPAAEEKPEDFVKLMLSAVKAGEFPENRLLQLTFLAPQWTRFIAAYFDWQHLDEGVYWFLAHMRIWGGDATGNAALASGGDDDAETSEASADTAAADASSADGAVASGGAPQPAAQKKLSAWERIILERTPLTDAERSGGAVDVAWFRRTHDLLGPKKWEQIAAAARFAANASQAKRACYLGDVLLNKIKRQELVDGIKKKQLKEQVRLLGLLPLATGKKREADLIERCQVLRDYRRYANTLSGLTKPDALRAWEIGMKNLAQTAGFADPMRLEWAVGAEAVKDLAKGPVAVTKAGVTVTLSLDEQAKPVLAVSRGDKELKSIPPAIKKDKKIVGLTERVTDIRRQASSIRNSLEAAMCRGDAFTGDELRTWCGHALLAPLLSRLVIVGEGILGYPDKGGKALRDYRGKLEPVKTSERLRFAHPHDLLGTDAWQDWQRECFQAERMQPFKQIFRELYVLTKQEKKDGAVSHRYDGQQVQPSQALALFGNRGWNTREGVFKVFHDEGLTVDVHFNLGVTTPAEVEGWTLSGVSFRHNNDWKAIPLREAPPRLFSEVMRDLDLVVSVAHAGGVDPEASASTVEMRASLVRETCALLQLKNVRLKSSHIVIDGELATYSIHLGSGVVHRMPGGAICIVPVHAQQRGRIFLPFADDDPRTAEVISKTLLLARDHEIQDPIILEQLRR